MNLEPGVNDEYYGPEVFFRAGEYIISYTHLDTNVLDKYLEC